jgi:peptidoglycan/LPS O-acetylase OafA/YrhL
MRVLHSVPYAVEYDGGVSIALADLRETLPVNLHGVPRKRYLPQIDALRAVAALGVFFFHLYTGVYRSAELRPLLMFTDLRSHGGFWRWAAAPSLFGYAGVPLFFVISGFCIHHSFLQAGRPFSYWPFMGRRFWRIYPAYVFAIALSLVLPGNLIWRTHHVYKSVIFHLLFLHNLNQTTIFELSPPFWTLAVEFQFYAAYPIVLMLRRRLGIRRAVLISLLVCAGLSGLSHRGWIGHFGLPLMPVMFWIQWCLGALIAERFSTGQTALIPLPLALLLCIVGILFAVPISEFPEWNYLAWALLFAAIIERLIRMEMPMRGPFAAMLWLGTISYSFYLLHAMVLWQLLPRFPTTLGIRFAAGVFGILPLVIAGSAASYYLIESPGIACGRKCLAWFFRDRIHSPRL